MSKTVAMVPIKLNNERLPNKNIKLLGDKPLITYILETLKKVQGIDEIYVFCSDEAIISYLPENVIFLKRDKALDLPSANFTQFFEAFMQVIEADYYVFTHATAPFIEKETIETCLRQVSSGLNDSAFSAVRIQDFLWEDGRPLNFDASNIPRSQDLKPIFRETSGVYVFTREVFKKYKRRVGMNPFIVEVSWREAVDINTYEDFEMARLVLNEYSVAKFNLIFDLDGCIIDSEQVQRFAYEESYREVVGDNQFPPFEEYMKHTGDSLENIFRAMNLPLNMIEPYRRISNEQVNLINVNEELIEWIREIRTKKVRCAICTGKDRKRTIRILKYFDILDLFDAVVCSDDVDNPKPSAESTLLAMERINAKKENSILIGDGYNDILSAKNAGIRSVLTLWYGNLHVPRDKADYVAHTTKELEDIIDSVIES